MQDKFFDPKKFIDREFEQELFEELLQLKDDARVLAIRDTGGMGKSQLLQKFQYRCRTAGRPRTPVALIDLGQLPDSSPLAVVQYLAKEFAAFSLSFPNFDRLELARRAYDFSTIRGAVDLSNANLQGAHFNSAGVMAQITQAESVTLNSAGISFSPEQQATAQEKCVAAFWDDLTTHCQQQRIVILLDAYEKCPLNLEKWLVEHFLEPRCFDTTRRPPNLILVVAGRELPPFDQHWSTEECEQIVKSVRLLGKWSRKHVEECLRVHGFHYAEHDLDMFCTMVERGVPPQIVVQTMESILPRQGR